MKSRPDAPKGVTVVLLPDGGGPPRSLRISAAWMAALAAGLLAAVAGVVVLGSSWWFLALEAARGWRLQEEVDSLREQQVRVYLLAQQLERLEQEYEKVRALFLPATPPPAPDLWLPPTGLPTRRDLRAGPSPEDSLPTLWPLTEAGFITRPLLREAPENHPGVDIAVPTDSYVRAAGAGRVAAAGEDPVYGLFVALDHAKGYRTVYGHLSQLFVEVGQGVRKGEVIGLSGSTGQSTAPHLHFEILRQGTPVDPFTLVTRPG